MILIIQILKMKMRVFQIRHLSSFKSLIIGQSKKHVWLETCLDLQDRKCV